jgi:hypothetical protein
LASLINSKANPDSVLGFVGDLVMYFGEAVEKSLIMASTGVPIPSREMETRQLFEELIVQTVTSAEETFGHSWTKTREQKNGQDAFERRSSPVHQHLITSNESLGAMFSVMAKCLDKCPLLVARLAVVNGVYSENDLLLRHATDAAVASLYGCDHETTLNAILFLSLLVRHELSYYVCFVTIQLNGMFTYIKGKMCRFTT